MEEQGGRTEGVKKKRMQGQGGAEMEDPSVVGGADGVQEEMNDGGREVCTEERDEGKRIWVGAPSICSQTSP